MYIYIHICIYISINIYMYADRLYPDLAGTLSGRDLCACTNQTTFYMVDDQLQGKSMAV